MSMLLDAMTSVVFIYMVRLFFFILFGTRAP